MKDFKQVQWGSIAVTMGRLSFLDRLFITASLAGILLLAFPHITLAQTVQEMPMIFAIKDNISLGPIPEDYFARVLAKDIVLPAPDPRIQELREYLLSKNSPMAPEAGILLEQYHYRLILGISFAESNFCRYQIMPNNCWGIGGGNPESYPTLSDGIIRANGLIQKYQDQGMKNPRLMLETWVGWRNHNWVLAVEQITQELESQGL